MKRRFFSIITVLCVIFAFAANSSGENNTDLFIIHNPYSNVDWDSYNQYKAALHTHTTNSDGKESPESAIKRHHELGFDIIAITDHARISAIPDSVPTDMLFIPNSDERSLIVPEIADSNSFDDGESDKSHHVNTYWSTVNNSKIPVSEFLEKMAKENQANPNNTGFAVLNHPGRNTGAAYPLDMNRANDISSNPDIYKVYAELQKHPDMIGMEIINKLDNESQADRVLWDNILTELMPEYNVWGFSSDDSHSNDAVGFSYNLMLMPSLTLEEFRTSAENGAFFAFSRVDRRHGIYSGLNRDDKRGKSGSRFDNARSLPTPEISRISVENNTIIITASGFNWIKWYADGVEIYEGETLNLAENADKINSYVRAEVGSDNGVLYTQSFGVVKTGEVPVTAAVTESAAESTEAATESATESAEAETTKKSKKETEPQELETEPEPEQSEEQESSSEKPSFLLPISCAVFAPIGALFGIKFTK